MKPQVAWWLRNTHQGRRTARRMGVAKALGIPDDPCGRCRGTGVFPRQTRAVCPECNGTGRIT